MISLLKLLRIPNLIILAATIYYVAHYLVFDVLATNQIKPSLSNKEVLVLLFISLCIGAGGYIFNDIMDFVTDTSNKKRMIVGYKTSRKLAYLFYAFMVLTPLLAVYSLAQGANHPEFIWGYIVLTLVLLAYNLWFKRLPVLGNLTVALLCAFSVILPAVVEWKGLSELSMSHPLAFKQLMGIIGAFSIFSLIGNFNREVIKDIEDIHGDGEAKFKTLPLITSVNLAKNLTIILSGLLFALIVTFLIAYDHTHEIRFYIALVFLLGPLAFVIFATYAAEEKHDFSWISFYWKLYFLIGFISLILLT